MDYVPPWEKILVELLHHHFVIILVPSVSKSKRLKNIFRFTPIAYTREHTCTSPGFLLSSVAVRYLSNCLFQSVQSVGLSKLKLCGGLNFAMIYTLCDLSCHFHFIRSSRVRVHSIQVKTLVNPPPPTAVTPTWVNSNSYVTTAVTQSTVSTLISVNKAPTSYVARL